VAKYAAGHLLFLRDTTLMAQALDPTTLELGGEAVPIAEQILVGGPTGASGAFSVSENGRLIYQAGSLLPSQLTWFDRDGRPVGVLGEPAFYGDLALSPDGTQVAVTVSGGGADDADIWVYDVARRFGTRMTSHTAMDRGAVWSKADGRLAFVSNRAGPSIDVFVKPGDRADGEAPLVGTPDEDEVAESWSPDGRFLIYGASPAAGAPGGGLFVWSFADRRATPLVQTRFAETQARFSPDGRWVAYISNDSGPFQVYVTPFPGPGHIRCRGLATAVAWRRQRDHLSGAGWNADGGGSSGTPVRQARGRSRASAVSNSAKAILFWQSLRGLSRWRTLPR
jgi:WD40 repeat protein